MNFIQTGLKLFTVSLVAMFVVVGCGTNPASSTTSSANWFETTPDGRTTVPMDAADPWFTVQTVNTVQLQMTAAGTKNSVTSFASFLFPINATTGAYTVVTTKPAYNVAMAANTVYFDITSGSAHSKNVAQSGTVTLTVTGAKYTIDFTSLPSLTNDTPPVSGTLSGHLAM